MFSWTLLGVLTVGIAAYLLLSGFIKTYRLYRGVRVITCPENLQPAAVRVAAFDAAKWFVIAGESDVHLQGCSRWPEMVGCDQGCLAEIQRAPHACLVQTLVTSWYAEKHCHFCVRPIGVIVWHERPPAVVFPDGTTREWKSIAPNELPAVFADAQPVCWACHIFNTFRYEHPDLVIERARIAVPHEAIPPSVDVY